MIDQHPPAPAAWPLSRAHLRGHLDALLADFADRAVPATRLNVIAHLTDVGVPEPVVIALAELVDQEAWHA